MMTSKELPMKRGMMSASPSARRLLLAGALILSVSRVSVAQNAPLRLPADRLDGVSLLCLAGLRESAWTRKGAGIPDSTGQEGGAGGQRVPEVAQCATNAAADEFE